MMKKIRQCLHAGDWYTKDSKKLDEELGEYMKKVEIQATGEVKALIAPHAGYFYSGPTAAWAYRYIAGRTDIKNVFIIGPSHHKYFPGCALTYMDEYSTPLGNLSVDRPIVDALAKESGFFFLNQDDEEDEHSIELHLPYIFKALGCKATIIPILCGPVDERMASDYAKILVPYFDRPGTLFVFSTDFCHWGQRFQYTYQNPDHGQIWQSIERLDGEALNLLQKHDSKGFEKYISATKNTICGRHPLSIYLKILEISALKINTKCVKYAQSEQVKTPNKSSVSYASLITFIL